MSDRRKLRLGLPYARRKGGGVWRPQIYAYSAASPGGDGLTEETAFQTLAEVAVAAAVIGNNVRIGYRRGSHWREYQNLSTLSGVEIRSYGPLTDPLPKLDCSDVADNGDFSLAATYTNTYQITWAHDIGSDYSKRKLRMWEGGVKLKWVASAAACEAEAGTFHVAINSIANPATLYVHPNGSTNPTSDGKTYEITAREFALTVGTGYDVRGVHTTRNAHHDGSFYATGAGYGQGILSTDGVVHCQWVAVGSTHVDCVAYDAERAAWRSLLATLFITYAAGGGSGATYRNCYAYSDTFTTHDGYYSHTAGGGATLTDMRYEGCHYYGYSSAVNCANTINLHVTDFFGEWPIGRADSAYHFGGASNNYLDNITAINPARLCQFGTNIEITDLRAYCGATISGGMFWTSNVSIRNSSFAFSAGLGQNVFATSGAAVEFYDTAVQICRSRTIRAATAGGIASDRNVFWNTFDTVDQFQIGSTDYDFADWKTQTGEDAGSISTSVQATLLFTDAANNDFSFTDEVVNEDGRTAGSRKHIARPDWSTLVAAWQAGFLGIDGTGP